MVEAIGWIGAQLTVNYVFNLACLLPIVWVKWRT